MLTAALPVSVSVTVLLASLLSFTVTLHDFPVHIAAICLYSTKLQCHCAWAEMLCRFPVNSLRCQSFVRNPDGQSPSFKFSILEICPRFSPNTQIRWIVHEPALLFCGAKSAFIHTAEWNDNMRVTVVFALTHWLNADWLPALIKRSLVNRNVGA